MSFYIGLYNSIQKGYVSLNHLAMHLQSLPISPGNTRNLLASSASSRKVPRTHAPAGWSSPICWPRIPIPPDAFRVRLIPGSTQLSFVLVPRDDLLSCSRSAAFNSGNISKFVPFGVGFSLFPSFCWSHKQPFLPSFTFAL